ncbi:MAG: isochorismatase family cysteine hydrolase [Candidatus Paceibacterota bacterium]|jgi:nicotinamidase-related amidase
MAKDKILCLRHEVAVIGIDLLNGFFKAGKLADPNMKWIIPNFAAMVERLEGCNVIYTADNHSADDAELKTFPPHCMRGTFQAEVVRELKGLNTELIVKKKTTNSFIGTELEEILTRLRPRVAVFGGVCSDICVIQAVITLSSKAEMFGLERIIVPKDCMTTFGGPGRNVEEIDRNIFNTLGFVPGVEVIDSQKDLKTVIGPQFIWENLHK